MSTELNGLFDPLEDVFVVFEDGSELTPNRSQRSFSSSLRDLMDGSIFLHQESMFPSEALELEADDDNSLFPSFVKHTNDSTYTEADNSLKYEESVDVLEGLIRNLKDLSQEPEDERKSPKAPLLRGESQKRIDKVSQLSHVLNVRVEKRLARRIHSTHSSMMSGTSSEASFVIQHSASGDHDERRHGRRGPKNVGLRRSRSTPDTGIAEVPRSLRERHRRRETIGQSDDGQSYHECFRSINLMGLENSAPQQGSTEHIERICHNLSPLSHCVVDHKKLDEPPDYNSIASRKVEPRELPPVKDTPKDKPTSNRRVMEDGVRSVLDVLKLKTSVDALSFPLSLTSTRSLASFGNSILGVSLRDLSINTDFSSETRVDD